MLPQHQQQEHDPAAPVVPLAAFLRAVGSHLRCTICIDVLHNPVSLQCGHNFCRECIVRSIEVNAPVCPLCKQRCDSRTLVDDAPVRVLVELAQLLATEHGIDDLLESQLSVGAASVGAVSALSPGASSTAAVTPRVQNHGSRMETPSPALFPNVATMCTPDQSQAPQANAPSLSGKFIRSLESGGRAAAPHALADSQVPMATLHNVVGISEAAIPLVGNVMSLTQSVQLAKMTQQMQTPPLHLDENEKDDRSSFNNKTPVACSGTTQSVLHQSSAATESLAALTPWRLASASSAPPSSTKPLQRAEPQRHDDAQREVSDPHQLGDLISAGTLPALSDATLTTASCSNISIDPTGAARSHSVLSLAAAAATAMANGSSTAHIEALTSSPPRLEIDDADRRTGTPASTLCHLCKLDTANRKLMRRFLRSILNGDPTCRRQELEQVDQESLDSMLGGMCGPFFRRRCFDGHHRLQVEGPVHAHYLCLVWSADVFVARGGELRNVQTAIEASEAQVCGFCGVSGATVKCVHPGCSKTFHVPCAFLTGEGVCVIDESRYEVHCGAHRPQRRPGPFVGGR